VTFLTKAQESLKVARLALAADCYNECASRAYYAVLRAAVAALLSAGQPLPSGKKMHEWVQGTFPRVCISRRKLYPARVASFIGDLRDLRETADYAPQSVSRRHAERALRKAAEFVSLVERKVSSDDQREETAGH